MATAARLKSCPRELLALVRLGLGLLSLSLPQWPLCPTELCVSPILRPSSSLVLSMHTCSVQLHRQRPQLVPSRHLAVTAFALPSSPVAAGSKPLLTVAQPAGADSTITPIARPEPGALPPLRIKRIGAGAMSPDVTPRPGAVATSAILAPIERGRRSIDAARLPSSLDVEDTEPQFH